MAPAEWVWMGLSGLAVAAVAWLLRDRPYPGEGAYGFPTFAGKVRRQAMVDFTVVCGLLGSAAIVAGVIARVRS